MAKTGFLVVIYQDVNPSSPTYNTTREERTQSEEFCPTSAEANWIEDTKYCELTENGMLTGYEITVYRDVEPLSSTYNQTREEKELNPTECEADETTPNWQNIGDPFCRQKVYLPGGLMGNDGYMIQQQQDMNEYSETADEIREIETLDLTNCPLPNTLPEWEVIYEACHIVKQDGQLMFDGTKDVVRIDRNQYSPSWNNNVPETVNIEDLVNCPPDIEVQYRWVGVSGEYMCVGYDKHSVEKKQRSTDGETWVDVMPLQTRAGALIEANSDDCGYQPTIEYRWVTISDEYMCVGFDKHAMEKKQQSVDGGEWTDVSPLETRAGELLEANSEDCGYQPTFEYRWVVITGQYECVGYDKYAVEKKQQSSDGGQNWTDVEPLQTRTGSLIERNSTDCGYLEPQYRWVAISDAFVCVGYDKHQQDKQQVSYDNGTTWEDVVPANTRTGSLIEHNSDDCGYVPETVYRWVTISDEYMCVGFDKHAMEKKQQSVDGGTTWTDVVPTETRAGELLEANSEDCGYTDFTTFDCGIIFTDLNTNDHHFSTNNGARFELLSTQVNNANGYIRVNFRIHIKKNMNSYDWVVRASGGTMAANRYIGNVVKGQVITDYFEVPCGSYNFMLMIQETISDTTLQYAQSRLTYICNDCSQTPIYTTRWVIDNVDYMCNGFDKYALEREQYYQNDEWWYTSKEREGALVESNSEDCGYVPPTPPTPPIDYSKEYFTIEAINGTNVYINGINSNNGNSVNFTNIQYKLNDGEWQNWNTTVGYYMTLGAGDKLQLKALNTQKVNDGIKIECPYTYLYQTIKVYGNINSLFDEAPTMNEVAYKYGNLFEGNDNIVEAHNLVLPALTLTNYCYYSMFDDCDALTTAPELPALTLADGCYSHMFYSCNALTTAPELPATTLAVDCYYGMFEYCSSLTTAPELPATELVRGCYVDMFGHCSNLNYIKAMYTTEPSTSYTYNWVRNVASTGTFVKNINATWDVTGIHGVPTSWVINYSTPSIPMQYRWTTDTETYVCVDYDKYSVEKLEKSTDGGVTWEDVVPAYTRNGSLIEHNSEDCGFVPYDNDYLTVESLADNNNITFTRTDGAYDLQRTIYVSTDNGAIWTSKSSGYSTPTVLATLNTGDKLLIKGTNNRYGTVSKGNVISSTNKINVYGNIMSLVYGDDFIGETEMAADAFVKMFSRNPYLISAENLVLPSTTMTSYCYYAMFWNCTGLVKAPQLPATTLAEYCYDGMFEGCTSLTTAPELPATTLVSNCYSYMFNGCTSLNYIYAMFTTTPSTSYTNNWVKNVAESGTFVKSNNAEWDITGVNGVPTSWTVQNENYRNRWITVSDTYVCVGRDKYSVEKRQQSVDGGETWTDVVPTETRTGSLIEHNSADCSYDNKYLTTEHITNGTVQIHRYVSSEEYSDKYPLTDIQYSKNGGAWTSISYDTDISVNSGDKIEWKANANVNDGVYNVCYTVGSTDCVMTIFKGTSDFNVSGNIKSLIYNDDFKTIDETGKTIRLCFLFDGGSQFGGNSCVVSAENLVMPANIGNCRSMFSSQTKMTTAPSVLPATTLAQGCYSGMFSRCTNLVTAPELPATTLVHTCYQGMFYGCSNLNSIVCLATDISAIWCTENWVKNVASSGTFTKASLMSDWTTGTSGIPSGWTILNQ